MAVKQLLGGLWIPVVVVLAPCGAAADEVFILKGGGRVVGELLNPEQLPRETYVIKTPGGGQVTLDRSQVEQTLHRRDVEVQYEKIRPRHPDTVEGQWALAEWCREHSLSLLRKVHLERVVELDPDHEQARYALGYFRRDGQWKTRKQLKEEDGYIWYKGRHRLPQEIQLMEEKKNVEAAEGEWMKNLKLWRGWLFTTKYHAQARENIRRIDDPYAVKALARALEEDDRRDRARLLYIEALARIGTPTAKMVLAAWSIRDSVEEVRLTCLDYLEEEKNPDIVRYYVGKLHSASNTEVDRAAVGLRRMGDRSAIAPLIDALVTTHKRKITTGNPGQMSMSFPTRGSAGPTGMAMGGGTRTVTYHVRNRPVLEALISLSDGANHGFDVGRWKAWYASQKKHLELDARRD